MKSIEDAITEKFPDVIIHEVRNSAKFGIRILGTIPAQDEYDKDHIVEWTGDGRASECYIDSRDYREIAWNEEEQRPEYIKAKLLIHNDRFNVQVDASKQMSKLPNRGELYQWKILSPISQICRA